MIKLPTVFLVALVAMASGVLFHTSYDVRALDGRLDALNQEILQERQSIRVLRAEWAYLNQPSRLRELAGLSRIAPVTAGQVVASIDEVPMPLPDGVLVAAYPVPGRKPAMPAAGPAMIADAGPVLADEPPATALIQTAASPMSAAPRTAVSTDSPVDVLLASFRQNQPSQEIAR